MKVFFRPPHPVVRWLCPACLALVLTAAAWAADNPASENAYQAAVKAYNDKNFDFAEKGFEEFTVKFPESPRLAEAVLLQAQCRFALKKYADVIELLSKRTAAAGTLADRYRFWAAEAHFENNNLEAAAAAYGDLLRDFPNSSLRLRASYRQALARFRLNEYKTTVDLLQNPSGAFQEAARRDTNNVDIARGYLLLGDAYFEQKNYAAAESTLNDLGTRKLDPELDWRRQYLIANSQLASGKAPEALQRVTNLVDLAVAATNPVLRAISLMFRGAILDTNQPAAAIETYREVTEIKGIPATQIRQAVLNLARLYVQQNRLTNAMQWLSNSVSQYPQDSDTDLVRLSLGEVYLKQFHALADSATPAFWRTNRTAATNFLQQAKTQFDFIINTSTNSPQLGTAYLDRGWCLWEEAKLTGEPEAFAESRKAFDAAAARLVIPSDQALARFKSADCLFEQKDFPNAIRSYETVLELFAKSTPLKTDSFDRALYQIVRAAIEMGDFARAKKAVDELLNDFPKSSWGDDGLVALSQALLNHNEPGPSRDTLLQMETHFAESPLLPDALLLKARTYVRQTNWAAALGELDRWVTRYSNHVKLPQAEFERAWIQYQSGNETNAFAQFTNFAVRFAVDPLAPLAQWWVGDYYYRTGRSTEAETVYQKLSLSTNAAVGELKFRAQLMAASAALLHYRPGDARGYLTKLLTNPDCPPSLVPRAFFLYGESEIQDVSDPNPTNALNRFSKAITAFIRVTTLTNAGPLEPLARGRIGDCHFALAQQDPSHYAQATNEWHQVLTNALAGVAARSQAEIGLAKVYVNLAESKPPAEQRPLLELALQRYLNVVYGKLREGEAPNPFWVKEAGVQAGQLAVRLQKTTEAIHLYERLARELPALRETWAKKIAELQSDSNH